MQDVGGGGDGVGAEEELETCLLGGGYQAVGRSLVACDVHIAAGHFRGRFYAVGGGHAGVHVVAVVEAGLHHLDVVFGDGGFLGEFLAQEVGHQVKVAVEEPAHQAKGKHVAALEHRLVVHAAVGQTVFHHLGDGACHHAVGVDAHLAQVVVAGKLGLLQVFRTEAVGVDDDGGLRFGKAVLCLQGGGVHGHQHVALVAGGVYLARSDVYLESAHTGERPLRGADVGGIVGECGDAVAYRGRHRGENVSGQLHAVAAVAREAYDNLLQFFHFHLFCHK